MPSPEPGPLTPGQSILIQGPHVFPGVRLATPGDLSFCLDLQRKFSNELGFLPRQAIEWYLLNSLVRIAFENGHPAGYLLGRPRFKWQPLMRPITQAAIAFDAQRRGAGLALVESLCFDAACGGLEAVQAMCAADLEANSFWKIAGFTEIGRLVPDNTRARQMICWRRFFDRRLPAWAANMPPVAGWKGKAAAMPRR